MLIYSNQKSMEIKSKTAFQTTLYDKRPEKPKII